MLTSEVVATIRQKKLDALGTKHVHQSRMAMASFVSKAVDALALCVPAAYAAFRILAKGTSAEHSVEMLWEILASLLFAFAIWKLVYQLQDKTEQHKKMMAENIRLAGLADSLLQNHQNASEERVAFFLEQVQRTEADDREILGKVKKSERQNGYREALKESSPGNAKVECPVNGCDVWNHVPGGCDACGGTPRPKAAGAGS
jgi:mobilome CxxCx(11)CxxC protein